MNKIKLKLSAKQIEPRTTENEQMNLSDNSNNRNNKYNNIQIHTETASIYLRIEKRSFLSSGTSEIIIISFKSNISQSQDFQRDEQWMCTRWGSRAFWSCLTYGVCSLSLHASTNARVYGVLCRRSKTPKLACDRPILLASHEILTEHWASMNYKRCCKSQTERRPKKTCVFRLPFLPSVAIRTEWRCGRLEFWLVYHSLVPLSAI